MIKRYKYQQMTPYSLHDMTVNKIECMNNEIECVHYQSLSYD